MKDSVTEQDIAIPAKYAGKWIAWNENHKEIVSSGNTLQEARKKAFALSENKPWLDRVPDASVRFGGSAFRT